MTTAEAKNTLEQERRFTILEEQGKQNFSDHKMIMETISRIDRKLDTAIKEKADREDVDEVNKKLWGFATVIITAFVGLIVYLFQSHIK
jgi:hypothetical protein